MGIKECRTTTNLWLDVCDYYNMGLTFKDISECLSKQFPEYGMPQGASTSMVIDLYFNPDEYLLKDIIYDMYYELNRLVAEKKGNNEQR